MSTTASISELRRKGELMVATIWLISVMTKTTIVSRSEINYLFALYPG